MLNTHVVELIEAWIDDNNCDQDNNSAYRNPCAYRKGQHISGHLKFRATSRLVLDTDQHCWVQAMSSKSAIEGNAADNEEEAGKLGFPTYYQSKPLPCPTHEFCQSVDGACPISKGQVFSVHLPL